MESDKLKTETLEELQYVILPLVREAKTFEDLLALSTYIEHLVSFEDGF